MSKGQRTSWSASPARPEPFSVCVFYRCCTAREWRRISSLVSGRPARSLKYVQSLATQSYGIGAQGAAISSGSFLTMGMVIAPCSMRTLAAIAHGLGDNLIHRAADVILKERRKLVLVVRESPFSEIHLENMLKLARMGVVIVPPVPAFYNHPQNLDDMINNITMRVIDQFDIHLDVMNRWDGVLLDRRRSETE